MRFKKAVTMILTTALSLSMLTGCGGKEPQDGGTGSSVEDSAHASDNRTDATASAGDDFSSEDGGDTHVVTFPLEETMTFTAFSVMNTDYTLTDNPTMQKVLADANIQIEFTNVLEVDIDEKRNTILNSNQYPDMFYKAAVKGDQFGMQQGVLIPLEDLIRQYAPNLTAVLDERDGWQYITSADGHVYTIPEIDPPGTYYPPLWINKRWMDNLDLKEPTSFEELYQVLKAFKEQDANGNGDPDDEIPLFCSTGLTPLLLMGYVDYPYAGQYKLGIIDGELTYVPATEKFKEFLAYVAKLYQEGLLDKNSFTQSYDQQSPIGQSGDVLGAFFDHGPSSTVGRDNYDDYICVIPWDDCLQMSAEINDGAFAITDHCEHPEVLVAWIDQFYTEEGGILAWMGIEGETYQYNDKGEWEWILGNGYGDDITSVRSSATLQGAKYHPSIQPDTWYAKMSSEADPAESYRNAERAKLNEHGIIPLPNMQFTEEQSVELSTYRKDINSYISTYMAEVATGKLDLEESWDNYIQTLKKMNMDRMVEIYREVYDAAMAR